MDYKKPAPIIQERSAEPGVIQENGF